MTDLPSRLRLPPGPWCVVIDGLCAHFPAITRTVWLDRFARGRVLDAQGAPLSPDAPYVAGAQVVYFREVADETVIPFLETVLHADAHLVVADKPHFLPVAPTGRFVRETLLARLIARLGNANLVPLHRLDRDTAGLVMFSAEPATRDAYVSLFRRRAIHKHYEALAPPLPGLAFPSTRATRLARGEPFFRMREVDGTPDSRTRIDVIDRAGTSWRYALEPVTGRKHQLRVHMAALGAPIDGDPWYPVLSPRADDDFSTPLRLLARRLRFVDPISGQPRDFVSERHC